MLNLFSVNKPSHLIMKKMKQMLSLFLVSGSRYLTFKCWPEEGECGCYLLSLDQGICYVLVELIGTTAYLLPSFLPSHFVIL